MFWKREILHDWMETPDSIAICFYAVSGSPLSWRALTHDVHLLLSPASHEACCCQKALIIDHRHRLFWRSVLRPQFFLPRRTLCFIVLLLRDPTPMQVSKRHSCDSQGSCGVNYLSQPPTQPCRLIWISFLCEFRQLELEHLRGVRLLQV